MTPETGQKIAYLICFVVISIVVTGYFVGLQSPMNPATVASDSNREHHPQTFGKGKTIEATEYSRMAEVTASRSGKYRTRLSDLKWNVDPLAEFTTTAQQKKFALQLRGKNRAFNGAPPTVPHPIEQMPVESCLTCHGKGFKSESLRISKMSHQFLNNCTQCHVESSPRHMPASVFRENSFVGLPAPTGGERAFPGAPPTIPHSTWMRVDCMSCHGFAGQQGIRTTHPWRQNCQQCHTPSSELDQIQLDSKPKFLPPIKIAR